MRLLLSLALGLSFFVANVTAELPTWISLADRARWAANAHNVQSWKLSLVPGRPDQRRLTLDPGRLLPETDPPKRQLTISLGTFLAVLQSEAQQRGARIDWESLQDGQPGALLTLLEDPKLRVVGEGIDALTAPTVKYRTQAMELDSTARLNQENASTKVVRIQWLAKDLEVGQAKEWAERAYAIEMDLPRTRDESIRYTRYGEAARGQTPWGITLVPNFPKNDLFWIETLATWFPQSPEEYAKSAKGLLTQALKPVTQIVVITSQGNSVRERLETGLVLQKLWLEVRSAGGELLPLSQGLEEFPEMAVPYREAHDRWARNGETVQMVLALFKPAKGEFLASPRLPASAIVE